MVISTTGCSKTVDHKQTALLVAGSEDDAEQPSKIRIRKSEPLKMPEDVCAGSREMLVNVCEIAVEL